MHHHLGFILVSFPLGLLNIGYAFVQVRTGESLQWITWREQVTKQSYPMLFWANVVGSGAVGALFLLFSVNALID